MEVVLAAAGSILTVLLFAVIFCILGGVLSERMEISGGDGCYVFAASYFIGMAVYLALFRTLAVLTSSYRIAFWCLLILLGIAAAVGVYRQHRLRIAVNGKWVAVAAGLWLVHIIHALLYRSGDIFNAEVTPYSSIGTIQSLRYAGIAAYFVEQDRIPILNQSYGQSLLASFSGLLGRDNLCFILVLWLALSQAFLCMLLYGLFRRYFSVCLSMFLTFVVHAGSVSLTIAPIRVVDSDYPLLSNGYTDSVAGAATFLIYVGFLIHLLLERKKVKFAHCLVTVCCILYWAMSAPHNIVILCGAGFFFFLFLVFRKDKENMLTGWKLGAVILCSLAAALFEGGMLTPAGLVEEVAIEGVMTMESADGAKADEGIAIVPVMNYQFSRSPGKLWGLGQDASFMKETLNCAVEGWHNGEWYVTLYALSALWWDSIRVIFWPFLGVLGVGIAAYHDKNNKRAGYWAIAGVSVLIVGYPFAFLISYHAYKWALSRFMMPFYLIGMVFLAVLLGKAWKHKGLYRLIGAASFFIILLGQILDRGIILYQHCSQNNIWNLMSKVITFTNS